MKLFHNGFMVGFLFAISLNVLVQSLMGEDRFKSLTWVNDSFGIFLSIIGLVICIALTLLTFKVSKIREYYNKEK